ncbi:olfactory receptor 14A2-like [Tachyglossus aculeatus]|uniref:olfactory receptor 14A2-like n=1 Tax=Tachyglossus aculeatus TaxID=9261 RepID=UPI0018F3C615|nr:olfactory receptor 14A2-like [Tachyglossus aculeatus]
MYFFLKNLSFNDLCLTSITIPKSIAVSLTNNNSISFLGCASQVLLVIWFAGSEFFVLTAMSYDRSAAICRPLRYEFVMDRWACVQKDHVAIDVIVAVAVVLVVVGFTSIIISYVCIFSAALRTPSSEGRNKAFSTCMSHFTVVTVFLFTIFAYIKPPSYSSSALDLLDLSTYKCVLQLQRDSPESEDLSKSRRLVDESNAFVSMGTPRFSATAIDSEIVLSPLWGLGDIMSRGF